MNHNGCLLVRGDSGDPVEVVTQTVFHLWEQFGGTVNSKGYKVLDPHIKAIYGDSITPTRAEQIYNILVENGFAASNVALGVGSFSMQCLESFDENAHIPAFSPYTRDTFGIAIKATYAEDENGTPIPIFKNPKESSFKKSHKGCIVVKEENGELVAEDGHAYIDTCLDEGNLMEFVFCDGQMEKEYSLKDIRERLYGGKF